MSSTASIQTTVDTCVAWANNSVPLPFEDATTATSLTTLVALMFLIRSIRSYIADPILKQLGTIAGEYTHGAKWPLQRPDKIDNFSNFSFRFIFRCIVTGLGLLEFHHSPEWWYDTRQLWVDYPHHYVSNTVQVLYLLQLAYHLEDLVNVLLQGKSNRKDFSAMLIHHVVTALLLFGSSYCHTTRIGTIISTLHAITDVPKDLAKMAKQLEWKRTSEICFFTLVLSWIGARLYLYPLIYVWSAFEESSAQALYSGGMSVNALTIFRALLSILIVLNVMWFGMMLRLARTLLTTGVAEDPQLKTKESPRKPEMVQTPSNSRHHHAHDDDTSDDMSDDTSTTCSDTTDSHVSHQ